MKPLIFAYKYDNVTYYAEGYTEEEIRRHVELKLNLQPNTLHRGRKPDYNKELKEIWNKNNKAMRLLLTKEQTSSKEDIEANKKKSHCLYELDLFLAEDKNFLSGVNDIMVNDPDLEIRLFPNTGYAMAYYGKISDLNNIYRFPRGIVDAYQHIRRTLVALNIADLNYKKTSISNVEMCDSMIAGFNSPNKVDLSNPKSNMNPKDHVILPLGMLK
jgi:hypothetical protein